jgi:chemotaxis protein histidine kinase CheA
MNAKVEVQSIVAKSLENMATSLAKRCVSELCKRHGLNEEEEIENLGLNSVKVLKKAMREESRESWLPFSKKSVSRECCQGLSYNKGLFTQCMKRKEDGEYCKSCSKSKCGTVAERMDAGLYEYKDNKGRKPVRYVKYLEKCGKSVEDAKEEARVKGLEIDEEHLSEGKKEKKEKKVKEVQRGRPKKEKKVESEDVTDLFAKMTLDVVGGTSVTEEGTSVTEEGTSVTEEGTSVTEEGTSVTEEVASVTEEVASVAEEEDDYSSTGTKLSEETKKARKEAKAHKEAKAAEKKEAKLAQQKAEKEAKLVQQKAEKEAKAAQQKAEKEAKAAHQKAEKEAKAAEKEAAKAAKAAKKSEKKVVVEEEEKPKKVSVTRIKIDEVEYLKSGENILYNPETKEAVGLWDPIEKKINELPEEDDEEEEEEYDE